MVINVSEPFLPPVEDFLPYLREIWESRRLSNQGKFVQRLEVELARTLGVRRVSLTNNGTTALIVAMAALGLSGEVVTTPFSFVASAHAIKWLGLTPVFADIDPVSLTLDPDEVERVITDRTSAILAVNVYGRPCEFEALRQLALRRGLKLIFDSAHAFGVRDQSGSVLRHGDVNVMSFHATKVFHTVEGGAIACADPETTSRIERIRNFGFVNEITVTDLGLNAKMNELQAAVGLVNLPFLETCILQRRRIHEKYVEGLKCVQGIVIPDFPEGCSSNFSYFPVFVTEGFRMSRDALYSTLVADGIFARRYFFPLLSDIPLYACHPSAGREHLQTAHRTAETVLCLPLHVNLVDAQVERICSLISGAEAGAWTA